MKRKFDKLPKYWLGTRKSSSLGYEHGYGSGVASSTILGRNIDPETQALRSSIVPNGLNNLMQGIAPAMQAARSWGPISAAAISRAADSAANTAYQRGVANYTSQAFSKAGELGGDVGDYLTKAGMQKAGLAAAENAAKETTKNLAGKLVLGTIGKVAAITGAAYGGASAVNLIFHENDHRTGSLMDDNVSRTILSNLNGDSYEQKGLVDVEAEKEYARADRIAKDVNLTTTLAGTGAAIGSLFPGAGTLIGGGVGFGLGTIASLLGFGKTEEDVEEEAKRTNKTLMGWNKQQETISKAKDGKNAYDDMEKIMGPQSYMALQGPEGFKFGKPSSLIAPGEVTYNPELETGDIVRGKGNNDTVPSYISDGDPNIVYSEQIKYKGKSIAEHAKPIVKRQEELQAIANSAGGNKSLQLLQRAMVQRALDSNNEKLLALGDLLNVIRTNKEMKRYCKGKLPGFYGGKEWLEYGLPAVGHLAGIVSNFNDYSRSKYADTSAPSSYAAAPEWSTAVDRMSLIRYNAAPELNDILGAYKLAQYLIDRTGGLGPGGKLAAKLAYFNNKLKAISAVRAKENQVNNENLLNYLTNRAQYGQAQLQLRINDYANIHLMLAAANAAKELNMATYKKNALTDFTYGLKDILSQLQYDDARTIQDRQFGLYEKYLNMYGNKLKTPIS